jgi:AcrR family transcriptional regulator
MTTVLSSDAEPARRRRRAPRGQGERLREEILEAAQRLLLEAGDEEAVSIRAVADAVGVTPPSIYLHFADKTELIFAICEKHFTELDRVMQEATAGTDDPLESLRRRGRAYVQFGLEHPEEYRILFMTRPAATPQEWNDAKVMQSASLHHLFENVQQAIDAGALRPADPMIVSFTLWAVVHGLTSLLVAKPGIFAPVREALIEQVIEIGIAGFAPGASAPAAPVAPRRAPRAAAEPRRSAPAAPRGRGGRTASPRH